MNEDRTIQIRGANGALHLMQLIAEDYMAAQPDQGAVLVSGGGSYRGYKAVIDGAVQLGMVTTDLHRSHALAARDRGVKLAQVRYFGLTAVVAVTHPDNPVSDLPVDQLRDIFSGRIRNWQAIGGASMPIDVCIPPPLGSEIEHWRAKVLGQFAVFTADAQVLPGAKLIEEVARNRQAIGFVAVEKIGSHKLNLLRIAGIEASAANVLSRKYPVVQQVGVVHRDDPSPRLQSYLDHMLNPATLKRFEGHTRMLLTVPGSAA